MQADAMGMPSTRPADAFPGFTLRVLARNGSIREALGETRARLGRIPLSEEELSTVEVVLAEGKDSVSPRDGTPLCPRREAGRGRRDFGH